MSEAKCEVLLGQSYYLRFDPKLWRAMQPYPPLGTLYAASYLRARGWGVGLFDAMLAHDETAWATALDAARPRFAVLFEDNFNYLSKMCLLRMRQAGLRMIQMARERQTTVIVCGSDASDHAPLYLAAGAHFVIHGEGEVTLGELLDQLAGRSTGSLDQILGLTLAPAVVGQEQPLTTPARPVLRELDALPFPAWDLVELEHYRRLWLRRHGYFSLNLVTTRGCPFHCNWCAKPIWGQTYHQRSPDRVAAELAELKERYRPDHVWFCDDILGLKRGWFAAFAAAVLAQDCKTPFKCLSRADLLLREGEIEALRQAGAETVWIGAESGSQKILDAMDKGTRVEQIEEAARQLRTASVRVGFFLQFGYPGESRADLELTRAMVRRAAPDEIGISVSYPLPGTRFYSLVQAQLGSKRNWVDSQDLDMMYQGPFPTAFYRRLWRVINKEFRAARALSALAAALRQPRTWRPSHLRRTAAYLFHQLTLPWERWQLERAARLPHQGIGPLSSGMTPAAAAEPTPQASS